MRLGERLKELQDMGTRMLKGGESPTSNRRRHERYKPEEGVECPLGQLLDLSVGGLRAKSETRPLVREGQRFMLTIDAQGQSIKTPAQAVRVARYGLKHFETSVRFDHPNQGVRDALDSLAKFGFVGTPPPLSSGGQTSSGGGTNKTRSSQSGKAKSPKVSIDVPDPYRTLGISRGADAEAIHQGFRERARRFHPDVNSGPDAAVMFKRVNDAYKLLSNPEWRKTYDRLVPA